MKEGRRKEGRKGWQDRGKVEGKEGRKKKRRA